MTLYKAHLLCTNHRRKIEKTTQSERPLLIFLNSGRGERIRTSDLSVPNRAHYQAVLRPELLQLFINRLLQGLHSKSRS